MSTPSTNRRVHADPSITTRASLSPSNMPRRRALGELAPNTKVSPIKTSTSINLSPLKQSHFAPSVTDENTVLSYHKPLSQPLGRKRSIDEVDGAVAREDASGAPAKRHDARAEQPSQQQIPTQDDPSATLAAQIADLGDEVLSSTDEDSLELPLATHPASGPRASFSSLIDYNPASSQQLSSSPSLPAVTSTKSSSAKTQAETLRLRLRVALYKVKTNQTSVPLSRLEIPERYQRKIAAPAHVQPIPSSQPAQSAPTITLPTVKPSDANSRLLPTPILRPTAYSARVITEPCLPSSPPNSAAVDSNETPRAVQQSQEYETPIGSRRGAAHLSSPPGSEEHGNRQRAHIYSDSLTSSIVKGRAASGLLELMRSV